MQVSMGVNYGATHELKNIKDYENKSSFIWEINFCCELIPKTF